jgi:hypothetical protein
LRFNRNMRSFLSYRATLAGSSVGSESYWQSASISHPFLSAIKDRVSLNKRRIPGLDQGIRHSEEKKFSLECHDRSPKVTKHGRNMYESNCNRSANNVLMSPVGKPSGATTVTRRFVRLLTGWNHLPFTGMHRGQDCFIRCGHLAKQKKLGPSGIIVGRDRVHHSRNRSLS